MIQTVGMFNPDAASFAPSLHHVANPDHERTDAMLEYAQQTGLWGLPGAEDEPEIEEYEEMLEAFDQEYYGPTTNGEQDFENTIPDPDAINMDEMFELIDQANETSSDQLPVINDNNSMIDTNQDEEPLNWSDITEDFQYYALDVRQEEGRMEEVMTDDYAISIWSSYVQDCWDEEMHSELNALAGQNELRGILPSTL